jgi:3-hydroxyisobutyrate dehydrogenase-like beta-hydroxyacid dehydrogenase
MEIGFVGVGTMGFHLARRLIEAGHRLAVHDTRPEAMERLMKLGASAATSPRDVADRVETVMASLPSIEAVLAVATGPNGVIEGRKVRRFIDLSTTGARTAKRIADALAAKNIVQIDSPVSGGPGGAEKGTLAVMVSGPATEIELLRPALSVFGKVFVVGDRPGMGQTMKLANNMLSATAMAATSEAVVMGVKAGLDPAVMIEVINAGSGHNTASRDKFPRSVLPRTFDYGFTNGLMYKDLRLCLEEAENLGVPMRVGSMVRDMFEIATREYGADADFTTIVKSVEKPAGVEVRGRSE